MLEDPDTACHASSDMSHSLAEKGATSLPALLLFIAGLCGCIDRVSEVPECASAKSSQGALKGRCYRLPPGEFRGVLYPDESDPYFSLIEIVGHDERVRRVSTPDGTSRWSAVRDHGWDLPLSGSRGGEEYLVTHKSTGDWLRLQLPKDGGQFWFVVLEGSAKAEKVLLFLNPKETHWDGNYFGFVPLPH